MYRVRPFRLNSNARIFPATALLLGSLASSLLTGCSSESAPDTDAAPPAQAAAEPEPAVAEPAAPELPPVDGPVELLVPGENGEIAHVPSTYLEALQTKDKIVVVDFWAVWCGPCKMLAPELEKIAADNPDILIVKLDVDEASNVAAHYEASAIPDVRIFKNGQQIEHIIGYRTADQLLGIIRGS